MKTIASLLLSALLFVPLAANARIYDANRLPYNDVSSLNTETSVAISTLTREKVFLGNPDGSFNPGGLLNRAEYMQIITRILPGNIPNVTTQCFPDVPKDAWFAPAVCYAKNLEIVRGYQKVGVPAEQWLFEPARPVQYEEAIKILVELYKFRPVELLRQQHWYEPYIATAVERKIDLQGLQPGHQLTRAEMARLVVNFLAEKDGELELLRSAQFPDGYSSSSSDSLVCAPYVCSDGSTHPSCSEDGHVINYFADPCLDSSLSSSSVSSSSSSSSIAYDPDADASTRSNFLLLGTTSHVMAAGKVFLELEPLIVRDIFVTLVTADPGIDAFMVYDEDTKLLGRAYLDSSVSGGRQYRLPLRTETFTIPKETNFSFYVRPVLRPFDTGGQSGNAVEVSSLSVQGDGEWSNRSYTRSTTDNFNDFQTARSVITTIRNADDQNGILISGSHQRIGSFTFGGEASDSRAGLALTDLTFRVEQTGSVSLDNVQLTANNTSDTMVCDSAAGTITCEDISGVFGSLEDEARVITLYADVTVPSAAPIASLLLTLNEPGDVSSPGSISWTDGTSSFDWVPFDSPVVRGTFYSR